MPQFGRGDEAPVLASAPRRPGFLLEAALCHGQGSACLPCGQDEATGRFLEENKSPSRKVGEIDNRGSHYYLALYWAQALAQQTADSELAAAFSDVAQRLSDGEEQIVAELLGVQGSPADIGGYYRPEDEKAFAVMRPSATLNEAIDSLKK